MNSEEFWAILHNMPEPLPVSYRLYYNDDGTLKCYSMEDLPGNYIEIDAAMFGRGPLNILVVNGQIIELKPARLVKKLIPGDQGIACDTRDVCIVVSETQPHTKWSVKTNETN